MPLKPVLHPQQKECCKPLDLHREPEAQAAFGLGYTTMASFKGLTVGAMTGYFYAAPFTQAVTAKDIIKEDVNSPELNYNKLLIGRIGAFIHSDIIAAYDLKTKADYASLAMSPYILSEHTIHWAFSAANKPFADRVSAVLKKLVDNGTVSRILAKYR